MFINTLKHGNCIFSLLEIFDFGMVNYVKGTAGWFILFFNRDWY